MINTLQSYYLTCDIFDVGFVYLRKQPLQFFIIIAVGIEKLFLIFQETQIGFMVTA